MSGPLDSLARRRLYAVVQEYPGLHLRELGRRLGTPVRLVEYHAAVLVSAGILEERREGGYARLYPDPRETQLDARDSRLVGLLRKPVPLGIALTLLDQPAGLRHGELCEHLKTSKANLSHHLGALEAAGAVRRHDDRIVLADRAHIADLLRRHKPVPDMVARFAQAWRAIYQP